MIWASERLSKLPAAVMIRVIETTPGYGRPLVAKEHLELVLVGQFVQQKHTSRAPVVRVKCPCAFIAYDSVRDSLCAATINLRRNLGMWRSLEGCRAHRPRYRKRPHVRQAIADRQNAEYAACQALAEESWAPGGNRG